MANRPRTSYADRLTDVNEALTKGERLKLPTWCRIKTFCEAGLVELSKTLITSWCSSGHFQFARKMGRFWYINWRHFISWFDLHGRHSTWKHSRQY